MSTAMTIEAAPELKAVRGLVFDLIGTCTNWHTPVATCLKAHASRSKDLKIASRSSEDWDHFAHLWRSAFFKFVSKLSERDEMMNGHKVFQETLTMVLKEMLGADYKEGDWDATVRGDLVASWGMADAWQDTSPGLRLLREKFTVIGLSNGALAQIIKVNKRNDLQYDALLSSDVIERYKPNAKMYETAIMALKATENPGELAMVAAHAYDLQAAAKYGMRTIYIKRATEDMDVNLSEHKFDLVVDEGGLVELARRLGCDV